MRATMAILNFLTLLLLTFTATTSPTTLTVTTSPTTFATYTSSTATTTTSHLEPVFPLYAIIFPVGATFILTIIAICCCFYRCRRIEREERNWIEVEERNVDTSGQSGTLESLRIEIENFPRLEEALRAGPLDAHAIAIVDSILQRGNKAMKTKLLRHLEKLLKDRMTSLEQQAQFKIWAGTNISTGKITIVCLYKGNLNNRLQRFYHIDIFYSRLETPGPLPDIRNPEDMTWTMRSKNSALRVQRAIEKHGNNLFNQHSNLQAICGGPFLLHERQGFVQRRTTIILYCHAKGIKPYGEDEFPSFLKLNKRRIPVDIREGYFAQAIGDTTWRSRLCMGISIGELGKHSSGTLGPFVDLGNNGLGFITCGHVVGNVGTRVVQPSEEDIRGSQLNTICGRVLKWVFNPNFTDGLSNVVGVDAALVRLDGNRPCDPQSFPPIPYEMLRLIRPTSEAQLLYTGGSIGYSQESINIWGKSVIKYGRTTGFRTGFMALEGTMVKIFDWGIEYADWRQAHIMKGQYLIYSNNAFGPFAKPGPHRFADLGDSGAGVFMVDDMNQLTLIGLVTGIMCTRYDHGCIVTPIEYVLRALNVSPDQLRFGERMEHYTTSL